MSTPQTQRAWRVVTRGSPRQALSLDDIPVPTLQKGDSVLVQIEAAALNPVGIKVMQMLPNFVAGRPRIAENDLAGTVVDGSGTDFKAGDKVFGIVPVMSPTRQGTLLSYATLPADHLALRPPTWTAVEAAGLALVGLTAYNALIDVAKIEAGQSVFVNGGSSSVGSIAVQIAKAKGCKVVASCSGPNVELVKSIGADEILDYTEAPLHEQLAANPPTPRFHVIVDAIGTPSLFAYSEKYLAPSGIYVGVGSTRSSLAEIPHLLWDFWVFLRPTWLGGTNRKFALAGVALSKENLQAVAKLAHDGKIKPVIDSVFPFDRALEAFDRLKTGRARGKIVITVP